MHNALRRHKSDLGHLVCLEPVNFALKPRGKVRKSLISAMSPLVSHACFIVARCTAMGFSIRSWNSGNRWDQSVSSC